MEEELTSSDLEELQNACKALEDEYQSSQQNIYLPKEGEDYHYLIQNETGWADNLRINLRDLNICPDDLEIHLKHQNQSENVSSEPRSQLIKGISSMEDLTCADVEEQNVAIMAITEEKEKYEEEDLELTHIEPGWVNGLSIKPRVPNIRSPEVLGIHLMSQRITDQVPNIHPDNLEIQLKNQNQSENVSSEPSGHFIAGKVSYTKEECLRDFIRQFEPSSHTQGCVLKEMLSVEEGEYTEGKHFTHNKNLHQGAFAKVDMCQDNVTGYEFIRKKILLNKFRCSEALFLPIIKHKNIMKICGVIQRVEMDGGNVIEILMVNAGMSLVEFVKSLPERETLSHTLIWDLLKQTLEGLSMIHKQRIIHLDIKPENLCVQEDNRGYLVLTITDFGSAIEVGQKMDFVGWTPEYMAPETCRCYLHSLNKGIFSNTNNQITGKVDVFSLGLTALFLHEKKHVLLNLLTEGQNSYSGLPLEKKKLLQLQLLKYLAKQEDFVGYLISDDCSMDMRDVLSRMLSGSADMRPTAEEALAYMTVRVQEVKQTVHQPVVPKPDVFTPKKRNNRGRHNPSNKQFETEKGRLVTQPSCNSFDYISRITEVPVFQHSLPTTINSLPEIEPGPIKNHSLKQRLREKINPYLKTKIWVPKENEASNSAPMVVKHSSSAYTQSPASYDLAASKMERCNRDIGHNITQADQLGITHPSQIPDTKPVLPSSPTDQSINIGVLCENIPYFDVLINI